MASPTKRINNRRQARDAKLRNNRQKRIRRALKRTASTKK